MGATVATRRDTTRNGSPGTEIRRDPHSPAATKRRQNCGLRYGFRGGRAPSTDVCVRGSAKERSMRARRFFPQMASAPHGA